MTLYMAVTNDEYELPVAVAETLGELSEMMGVSKSSICNSVKRNEGISPLDKPKRNKSGVIVRKVAYDSK